MKPLTIQMIRAASVQASDILAPLPPGLTALARSLSGGIPKLSATAPVVSYESCGRLQEARPVSEGEHAVMLIASRNAFALRLVVDRTLVYGLCDLAFGGVGNEPPFADDRPLSAIERVVADLFATEVAEALPGAFDGLALPSLTLNAGDCPPHQPVVSATLLAAIHGASGELRIEFPQAFIDLFRPAFAPKPVAAAPKIDNLNVELTAMLAEMPMTLADVARLARGQLIRLDVTTGTPVCVMSEGVELFRAKLGQSARRYCLGVV